MKANQQILAPYVIKFILKLTKNMYENHTLEKSPADRIIINQRARKNAIEQLRGEKSRSAALGRPAMKLLGGFN